MTSPETRNHPHRTEEAGRGDDDEIMRLDAETTVREFLTAGGRRGLTTEQMFPQ